MTERLIEGPLVTSLDWIVTGAYVAMPIFLLVVAVDLLFRGRIAPRYLCLLWMMVAVRLVCPFGVESTASLQKPMQRAWVWAFEEPSRADADSEGKMTFTYEDPDGDQLTVTFRDVAAGASPEEVEQANLAVAAEVKRAKREAIERRADPALPLTTVVPPLANRKTASSGIDWGDVASFGLIGGWFLIASLMIGRSLFQSARFALRLRHCPELTDQPLVDEVLRVCDTLRIGRRPRLREVKGLDVPAVFGLFRPTICLPEQTVAQLSGEQLRLVLMHEAAHIKRRDGLVVSMAQIVRALHWFNPMAWVMVSRLRHFMEQSADDVALRKSREASSSQYGELLIRYALCDHQRPVSTIGLLISTSGRILATRIRMLSASRRRNNWVSQAAAVALVSVLGWTGLTNAISVTAEASKPWQVPPTPRGELIQGMVIEPMKNERQTTVTYDVREALARIAETHDDAKGELARWLLPMEVELNGEQLRLTCGESQHKGLQLRLDAIAQSGLCQIVYSIRFVEAELDFARQVGVQWEIDSRENRVENAPAFDLFPDEFASNSDQSFSIAEKLVAPSARPVFGGKLQQHQLGRFLVKCQSSAESNIMFAPKMAMFNGQTGMVSAETWRPFVTALRPLQRDGVAEVEPVIRTYAEGIRVHLSGAVTKDDELSFQCILTESEIDDVALARYPITGNQKSESLVQVPRAHINATTVKATIQRGESIIIAVPALFEKEQADKKSMARFYLIEADWFREPVPVTSD